MIYYGVIVLTLLMGNYVYTYREVPYEYYVATQNTDVYGDEAGAWVPLPFTFHYNGQDFDSVYITTNGYMSFTSAIVAPYPQHLPDSTEPNGVVAPFWKDFVITSGVSVKTSVYGTAPDRYFVVEWDSLYPYGGDMSNLYRFEAVLFENGGDGDSIKFSYFTVPESDSGWSAVAGIESLDGKEASVYSYNGSPNPITTGKSVVFYKIDAGNDWKSVFILEPSSTRKISDTLTPIGIVQNLSSVEGSRYAYLLIKDFRDSIIYFDSTSITIPADTYAFVNFTECTLPDTEMTLSLVMYLDSQDNYLVNDTVYRSMRLLNPYGEGYYYRMEDLGNVDFIDISANYDTMLVCGLNGSRKIALPFAFHFADTVYDSACIGISGAISLNSNEVNYTNTDLYQLEDADFIAVLWETWAGSETGTSGDSVVYIKSFGRDSVIVMWKGMEREFYSAGPLDFEAILYPDGNIKMLYNLHMNYWASAYDATIGIHAGGDYVEYTYDETPWIPDWYYPHGIYFTNKFASIGQKRNLAGDIVLKSGLNFVYYLTSEERKYNLNIYDAQGRKIKGYLVRGKGIVSLKNLRNGVYFITLESGDKKVRVSTKVIVVK